MLSCNIVERIEELERDDEKEAATSERDEASGETLRVLCGDQCNRNPNMAHNLTGDVKKFTVLEHLDTGDPKTTDLDRIIEGDELNEEAQAKRIDLRQDGEKSENLSSSSDKEDIITVKYLPFKMSTEAIQNKVSYGGLLDK